MSIQDSIQSILLEMRRGTLIISVLSQLKENEYGYSLVNKLESKGMSVEPGTLYPLLRRLEKQGLLESSWDLIENRPRRYYRLSQDGITCLQILSSEWQNQHEIMSKLLSEEE